MSEHVRLILVIDYIVFPVFNPWNSSNVETTLGHVNYINKEDENYERGRKGVYQTNRETITIERQMRVLCT